MKMSLIQFMYECLQRNIHLGLHSFKSIYEWNLIVCFKLHHYFILYYMKWGTKNIVSYSNRIQSFLNCNSVLSSVGNHLELVSSNLQLCVWRLHMSKFSIYHVSLGNEQILSIVTDGFNSRSFLQQIFSTIEKRICSHCKFNVKIFDTNF